ncbi:MAG: indolepyruvate oxidoreductase subunit beta [Desulfurococcaceae archaeon TW002]
MLNTLISGVGGQGLLTLSRVLGQAALNEGLKVIISEIHGLSQRGGSVTVFLRIGNSIMAPLPPEDDVNLHISMELIEAARYSYFHNVKTVSVVNDKIIRPSLPGVKIPPREELISSIKKTTPHFYLVAASDISLKLGSTIGANVVMLGFVTYILEKATIISSKNTVLNEVLKLGTRELNIRLFEAGYQEASTMVNKETIESLRINK